MADHKVVIGFGLGLAGPLQFGGARDRAAKEEETQLMARLKGEEGLAALLSEMSSSGIMKSW